HGDSGRVYDGISICDDRILDNDRLYIHLGVGRDDIRDHNVNGGGIFDNYDRDHARNGDRIRVEDQDEADPSIDDGCLDNDGVSYRDRHFNFNIIDNRIYDVIGRTNMDDSGYVDGGDCKGSVDSRVRNDSLEDHAVSKTETKSVGTSTESAKPTEPPSPPITPPPEQLPETTTIEVIVGGPPSSAFTANAAVLQSGDTFTLIIGMPLTPPADTTTEIWTISTPSGTHISDVEFGRRDIRGADGDVRWVNTESRRTNEAGNDMVVERVGAGGGAVRGDGNDGHEDDGSVQYCSKHARRELDLHHGNAADSYEVTDDITTTTGIGLRGNRDKQA
ncbi:hypothetical protein HK101_007428, partial [Irineochytrium annulatum]